MAHKVSLVVPPYLPLTFSIFSLPIPRELRPFLPEQLANGWMDPLLVQSVPGAQPSTNSPSGSKGRAVSAKWGDHDVGLRKGERRFKDDFQDWKDEAIGNSDVAGKHLKSYFVEGRKMCSVLNRLGLRRWWHI